MAELACLCQSGLSHRRSLVSRTPQEGRRAAGRHAGAAQASARAPRLRARHMVLAVGYDDALQRFLVMNSWGTGWGMQGYFTLPYAYLTAGHLAGHLADYCWTVRTVET